MGELKQVSDPQIGTIIWVRRETLKAENDTADLWKPKWNENQTVLPTAICTLDRDAITLEGAATGSWRGFWHNLGERAAVDYREMYQGDMKEEIVVVYACEGKPGSHESKAILLSHA